MKILKIYSTNHVLYNTNCSENLIQIKTDIINNKNYNFKNTSTILYQEYLSYNHIKLINIGNINNQEYTSNKKISVILSCGYTYNTKTLELYNKTNKKQNEYINNHKLYLHYAYQEALQIITLVTQGIKSNLYYFSKANLMINNKILINKKIIQKTLGPLKNLSSKYLSTKIINNILKQLKLNPEYNYYTKNFTITIPEYRNKDLYREIDIIEEIGRLYGYKHFLDKLPYKNQQGFISSQYYLINKIRQTLRDIGLHEVINSSLTKKNKLVDLTIQHINIYNPLLEDQSILRYNLIENLIYNKVYNYRQKNRNIEIFEIGKVFSKSFDDEQIHLAGIMANDHFIQTSWKEKSYELNWFHAKGIIEYLFEKLQIDIYWEPIKKTKITQSSQLFNHCYNSNKTAYIKTVNTNIILGIFGQITNTLSKNLYDNKLIYIFEINLNILRKIKKQKKHLEYTLSEYSIYPSVSRDISIEINKNITLSNIKRYIHETNPSLIEKIDVFNEYYNKKNHKRYIGIRITYRAHNKTLNNYDTENIDNTIKNILDNINKSKIAKSKP